jgi:hypothetical protein
MCLTSYSLSSSTSTCAVFIVSSLAFLTGIVSYDAAHDAFMTLPPYNGSREGMGSSIGGDGPNPCWRAFA